MADVNFPTVRSLPGILLLAAAISTPAQARTPYDGRWSVVIVTDSGICDRAYRYEVLVENGIVRYAGEGRFAVRGRVQSDGRVQVSVRRGGQGADGSGRLSSAGGGGTWQGASSRQTCTGRWHAERR
jgi:hypothetical protein